MAQVWRFGRHGPEHTGWAPYVLVGGGVGAGALVFAIAMFLKHA